MNYGTVIRLLTIDETRYTPEDVRLWKEERPILTYFVTRLQTDVRVLQAGTTRRTHKVYVHGCKPQCEYQEYNWTSMTGVTGWTYNACVTRSMRTFNNPLSVTHSCQIDWARLRLQ